MKCLMDHIVLNVEDMDSMINFYSKVLMLETERMEEYRNSMVPFPSVRLNPDTVIDLFPKSLWVNSSAAGQRHNNLNHFCISMTKQTWDELNERLNTNNIEIEDGPVPRWGAHGTGISIYFKDPEGNTIEARYYEHKDGKEKCLLDS